jgi:hypothetical protein
MIEGRPNATYHCNIGSYIRDITYLEVMLLFCSKFDTQLSSQTMELEVDDGQHTHQIIDNIERFSHSAKMSHLSSPNSKHVSRLSPVRGSVKYSLGETV